MGSLTILDELRRKRDQADLEPVTTSLVRLSMGWCEKPPGSDRWVNAVPGWVAKVEPDGGQHLVEIWRKGRPDVVEYAGELPSANAGMLWADSILSTLLKGA